MKINFVSIKIENFKNFDKLETNFGKKTYVYGANETGKTSFSDAISWCLAGKNSLGDSQFDFLPIQNPSSSPSVTLDIEIEDGKKKQYVTLKRVYLAKLNREKEYTGEHQTVCYINGLKTGVKEFDKWIEEHICSPEIFRLIHDVRYFTENISTNGRERPWEAQRRLLFMISGVKPDLSLAKSRKRFEPLMDGLTKYSTATQYMAFLKLEEKRLNDEIKYLDGRISMAESMIGDIGNDKFDIDDKIKKLKIENNKLESEIDRISTEALKALQKKISEKNEMSEKLSNVQSKIAILVNDLKSVKNSYKNIFFQCPTCGQFIPEEIIETQKKELEGQIDDLERRIKIWKAKETGIFKEIDCINEEIEIVKQDNSKSYQYSEMKVKLKTAQDKLSSLLAKKVIVDKNRKLKRDLQFDKESVDEKLDLKAEYSRLMDLCKKFIDAKCKYAEKKVNDMFYGVSFKLFRQNKTNSKVKDCCDIFWNGVPYNALSYSTKFVVSMKIALAFQKFYKVEMPLIVDNAESIDLGQELPVQTIMLVKKSENCKCGGETGRKESDGMWTCKVCGNRVRKTLEIMTE